MDLKQPTKSQLNPEIFDVELNPQLLAQAVRVHQIRKRQGTRKTKSRGEVRGGGRKPWRQKGTGRARHGSIRSPIWVGGGHAHPLVPRKHQASMPRKMSRKALFSALSSKFTEGKIFVADSFQLKAISTQALKGMLEKSGLEGWILIVLPEKDEWVVLSARNLPEVGVIEARFVTTYEVLHADCLVFVGDAIGVLEKTFLGGVGRER